MNRLLAITIALALTAGVANAKTCKDEKGRFTKCPPAAAATVAPAPSTAPSAKAVRCKDAKGKFIKCPATATAAVPEAKSNSVAAVRENGMPSVTGAPVCKVGKPCGKSCIAKDKVCHKNP